MDQGRRNFIKNTAITTGAALLGGNFLSSCNNAKDEPSKQTPVLLHEGLKKLQNSDIQFLYADGKPVDFGVLEKTLGKNNVSFSFMFGGCGDACPRSINVINQLSAKDANMKHVIISASPTTDFSSDPHSGLLRWTLNQYGVNYENSIILFPTLTGKKEDFEIRPDVEGQRKEFNAIVKKAQTSLNLLPLNGGNAVGDHSGKIKLYGPNGKFLVESLHPGADEMAKELLEKLVPAPSRSGEMQR